MTITPLRGKRSHSVKGMQLSVNVARLSKVNESMVASVKQPAIRVAKISTGVYTFFAWLVPQQAIITAGFLPPLGVFVEAQQLFTAQLDQSAYNSYGTFR